MSVKTERERHIRRFINRLSSQDLIQFPEWDITASLPKLPVPDLQSTLDKYLDSVRPLVGHEQFSYTRTLVTDFRESQVADTVQKELLQRAKRQDNWATGPWLNDMYLNVKLPLPINSNPGMVLPRQNFKSLPEQLRYAAKLVSGVMDYKSMVEKGNIPVDRARYKVKGQPLCMQQYGRLFSTYRVPGVIRDKLQRLRRGGAPISRGDVRDESGERAAGEEGDETAEERGENEGKEEEQKEEEEGEHAPTSDSVLIMRSGKAFVLPILSRFTDCRLTCEDIYEQLVRICEQQDQGYDREEEEDGEDRGLSQDQPEIALLTSLERNKWAKFRQLLLEDKNNRSNLKSIENCAFVLCLDSVQDRSDFASDHRAALDRTQALQMLHGGPSNSGNRWFDKTMQFIVSSDGAIGLCYEHSPAEGIVVVRLIEHLFTYMEEIEAKNLARRKSLCDYNNAKCLSWNVDEVILNAVDQARQRLDKAKESLDLEILRFTDFGSSYIKSANMSPDAFIQLSLQLSYYKTFGRLVSTYESAAIRRFQGGRVDNIRACTSDTLHWARAMVDPGVSDSTKMELLQKAISNQSTILVETILGRGFDNHLLVLKSIALEMNFELPAMFSDPTYAICNHFTMSTSQVPTSRDAFMCYGPVVPDGYGICYNPHGDFIVLGVSSYTSRDKPADDVTSARFASVIEESMREMRALRERTPQTTATVVNNP